MFNIDSNTESLFRPSQELPKGDDAVWKNHRFCWRSADTWVPQLSAWLTPKFHKDGIRRLKPGHFRNLPWDDLEWLDLLGRCLTSDIQYHTETLADALEPSTLRTFHGCRTDDAGRYFREGLHLHDRDAMTQRLTAIVEKNDELAWMRSRLDDAIAEINSTLDIGCLYVVADDTALLEYAAHYLIYGSEWITAVLGYGRRALLKTGVPTLIEVDLPLRVTTPDTRVEFARKMLGEWTRRACNLPDWHAPIDFSFCLRENIPPAWVVGHSHPAQLRDPLERQKLYQSPRTRCAHCSSDS
ncbi:hypothetical protein [Methylocystis sp. JR02]|uniref:hypothetical protein n=1 Tax=Methylocystis sp. JR02 TaxID=3046284 RepID=UPI0024BB492C|nr:hypothetical protein [Methylocystis sp. JR02]MDJ0448824.1 hypothetical protein [Methylocystis sp. JR02]